MQQKLLLASHNPGKISELKALAATLDAELVTLADLGIVEKAEETGSTYAENAVLKARFYAVRAGLPVLADDSGLEVDALGGEPGVRSARYLSAPGATDADRRRYLVSRLAGHPRPWTARFRCVVAVVFPDGRLLTGEGTCEGVIIPEDRGENGFGYDPILEFPDGRTMAELGDDEKNRVSHRARAVADLMKRYPGRITTAADVSSETPP
jgi:XTP/dITP diphosphohydrolase